MSDDASTLINGSAEPGPPPAANVPDPAVSQPEPSTGIEPALFGVPEEEETVEGVPVLAEARPIQPAVPAGLPAVQAVAVAATGFVAGAATIALVKRHSARKVARAARNGSRRPADLLPIVGSRTFLVDVHLIGKPQE